ncbi:hypothetical protein [Microcoleus sp. FACHB-672]|uniref:hypothetical protein n=1 Tax=Microcoleus sp. FACHB-672 TaxID=2692825 RepID=UPI0016828E3E|nr:hypothetical protein [Microcoleus sp. FACHB-672]MBD2041725.1 hypothetical protein [Microcoleus sp. FACHB-672]
MQKVISQLKNLRLRQVLSAFLVATVLFFSAPFITGNASQALAAGALTPEGNAYEIDKASRPGNSIPQKPLPPNTNGKNLGETLRERLNLDQPVPESTKEFFGSVKDKAEDILEAPQHALENAGGAVSGNSGR